MKMKKDQNEFKAILSEIIQPAHFLPSKKKRENFEFGRNNTFFMQSANSPLVYLTQLLPFTYHLCIPQVRDVNTTLFNSEEKKAFTSAIELMVCLNLRINQIQEDT